MLTSLTDISNEYSGDEILTALLSGGRTVRFRYLLMDFRRAPKGYLESVSACTVTYQYLADIKRTASFTITEDDDTDEIDWLSDAIQPYMGILMPDGLWAHIPLGVFMLSSPARQSGNGHVERSVSAYDFSVLLKNNFTSTRYTVAAGAVVTDTIAGIFADLSLTSNIQASPTTVAAARSWDPGTSWQVVVNDLLSMISYGSFWFDETGVAQARQYIEPALRTATINYITDNLSVIKEAATDTLDLWNVPNKWIAVVSQADRAALTSTYTNTNPTSPTSTVNRPFTITKVDTSSDAATQDLLDQYVKKLAATDSQVYAEMAFETALMPIHGENDTIAIKHEPLGLATTNYCETSWEMPLQVGASMKHTARRAVAI